jgi:hypothetical protein
MCLRPILVGIAVARSTIGADDAIRTYVLAQAEDFRRLMCSTLLDDSVESAQYAWDALSGKVIALSSGQACQIHRFELPLDHPLAHHWHPSDYLELGADNVVREV